MQLLKKFFGAGKKANEEAVIVYLNGTDLPDQIYADFDLSTLEDRLAAIVSQKKLGQFDGNEFGETETSLYLYGPDAEHLFSEIKPTLTAYPLCAMGRVVIRKGPPGAPEREVRLPD